MDASIAVPQIMREIPVHLITRDERQPRKHFDEEELAGLAASIIEHGLLQPITVQPFVLRPGENADTAGVQYRIVDGERRYRASLLAKRDTVLAIVREGLNDQDTAVLQIVANLQRSDLTLPEMVAGCSHLVREIGLQAAADRLGKSKSWVSVRATAADMPESIRKHIDSGLIEDIEVAHNLIKAFEIDKDNWQARDAVANLDDGIGISRRESREILDYAKREAARKESPYVAHVERVKNSPQSSAQQESFAETFEQPAAQRSTAETSWQIKQREQEKFRNARAEKIKNLIEKLKPKIVDWFLRIGAATGREVPVFEDTGEVDIDGNFDGSFCIDPVLPSEWQETPLPETVDNIDFNLRFRVTDSQMEKIVRALEPVTLSPRAAFVKADSVAFSTFHKSSIIGGVVEFLSTRTKPAPGERCPASELVEAYSAWCKKHKREEASAQVLAQVLMDLGYERGRTEKMKFYIGLSVK